MAARTAFLNYDMHELVDCAMGRRPADLVVCGGRWVCVQSGEIVPDSDVAVYHGRIAYVGPDASHTIGADTRVIDAQDRYISPACWMRTCTWNRAC